MMVHSTGGVYVYGLFLDGAGWDKKNMKLTEAQSKVLFTALPVIHVYAINVSSPKDDKKGQAPVYYKCPVYKKPNRTGKYMYTICTNQLTYLLILIKCNR